MVFLRVTTEPLVGYRLKMRAAVVSWRVRRLRAAAHRKARHVARARNLTLRLWLTALLAVLAGLSAASPAMAETVTFTDTTVGGLQLGHWGNLYLPDRRWRGDPAAHRRRGVLGKLAPDTTGRARTWEREGGGSGGGATVSGGSLHVYGAWANTVATFGSGPLARIRRHLRLGHLQHVGFGWTRTIRQSAGRCSAPKTPQSQLYTQDQRRTRPETRRSARRAITSAPRIVTGSSGKQARSGTSSTEVLVHTDIRVAREQRQRRRQRLQLGRPDALGRLAAHEPLLDPGHVHLARLRRRSGGQLGRHQLGRDPARKHQHQNQRAHRRHPSAGRHLELVHADRHQRGENSR